jgi:hypothetical protein
MCDRIRGGVFFFRMDGGYTKIVHFMRTELNCMS